MKDNFVHVCFVIDESGSMSGSESDVIGGFKKVIDEQKAIKDGTCSVSYFKFSDNVTKLFIGKDVNDVPELKLGSYKDLFSNYSNTSFNASINTISSIKLDGTVEEKDDSFTYCPHGCTALFDGIGEAIDTIGKWLDSMDESEKPEKNIIVIMTDGGENSSIEYSASKVKEMIKHQEEKYNWTFVYMGSDLTDAKDADSLGLSNRMYSEKSDYVSNYSAINSAVSSFRCCTGDLSIKSMALNDSLSEACVTTTTKYAAKKGLDANDLLAKN